MFLVPLFLAVSITVTLPQNIFAKTVAKTVSVKENKEIRSCF